MSGILVQKEFKRRADCLQGSSFVCFMFCCFNLCWTCYVQSSWSFDLKNKVQDFLASTLKSQEKPKLFTLYRENVTEIERERKLYSEQLKKLQTQLTRREQRSSQYQRRYSKIQVLHPSLVEKITDWPKPPLPLGLAYLIS